MKRCKTCGLPIPEKNITGFCSEKCESVFKPVNINNMDPVASFNMIGAAMEQAFQGQYSKKKYAHEINRKFFKSIICSAWCDCSDNFEQKKLIKNYEDFISASEKNS